MSIRIYALAQQLKVETKTLLDAIKAMGIDGKDSGLFSLNEDEVKKVKANFQKTASKPNQSGLSGTKEGQPLRHVLPTDAPVKKIPVISNPTQTTRKKDEPKKDAPTTTSPQKDTTKDKDNTKTSDNTKRPTKPTPTEKPTSDPDNVVKSTPTKSATDSTQVDTPNKDNRTSDSKNISVTKKEQSSDDSTTSQKTSKTEPKESTPKKDESPKTTSTPKQSTSGDTSAGTKVVGSPQPKNPQIGKVVVEKEMPKLPSAIGHIDISSIPGANKSNQHRGGGGGGQGSRQSGNRDHRNKSNSPLNHYLKKGGGGGGGKQQQQQNSNSQKPQQRPNQNQNQNPRQFPNQKSGGNQYVQPLRKPPIGTFDTGSDSFTNNSNYWRQRTAIDNKIPDLDGKRKKFDGDIDNKKDNKFPSENKQDPNRQQTSQGSKKTQAVNIFLAPIPTVKTKKQPKEPQAQKPDKRLPADVIRNVLTSGSGSSVDEFIRKHKDKQQSRDEERRGRDSTRRGGRGDSRDRGGDNRDNRGGGVDRNKERSGGVRSERDRDRGGLHDRGGFRDRGGLRERSGFRDRGGEQRTGDRAGTLSNERVGDRTNKDVNTRLPDRGDNKGTGIRSRSDRDRDRHVRGGRSGSDVSAKPDTFEFVSAGGHFGRESSRVAEEKRRRHLKKRRNSNDFDEDSQMYIPKQLKRVKRDGKAVSTAAPRKSNLIIHLPCTVKQLAEQTGTTVAVVMKRLLELKIPMQLNSQLDVESVELLAEALGIQVSIKENVSLEDRLVTTLFEQEDEPDMLQSRPPVVTVLGHVDHGKTTLLDNILKLNVVSGEKGGITQHIRAYRVKMENGEDITFVDTPGHEAFTAMRARGAGCTDIAVLVVAADDGVMPQTEEAISHAKAAGVPIIVAINKMDLAGMNPDRVLQELAANDLMPEEWGGDVPIVKCSGLTGMGLDKLLETIQVMAEVYELKANPNRAAIGVALEAELQAGQGAVCKVLVQKGTLRTGDIVLCGTAYGRVKAMYDTLDAKKQIYEATPSTPVNLVGLDVAPGAGSRFCVLDDISDARMIAEQRQVELRKNELAEVQSHVTLETLFQRIKDSQSIQTLNVIIRADVRGSIEAIRKELAKLSHPEVKIKILQATVGGISEADVHLADASDAIILGFNVVPDENARVMADRKKIQVRRYDIIYKLTDDIKKALEGMLKPLEHVKELGSAKVQQVFTISRLGSIAGCKVVSGTIERDCKIRVIRESRILGEYMLDSLKREKDDVKEIREGFECGIKLKGFDDMKTDDILEAYKIESVARTF
ncbi:MAG: translation initiation factor IF-2 [Planctomycetaceae bacterium]|nr:translation initiation factor IF-2 [Planctomycetaceae bacterium]